MKTSYAFIRNYAFTLLTAAAGTLGSQNSAVINASAALPGIGATTGTLANSPAATPIVRLKINSANFNDETVFYFQQGGTTGFQSDYDAYKLVFNASTTPYIGSISDSILTSISGLPELPVNLVIPVKAISPVTISFTFSTEKTDFPDNVCVTLFDSFTGISTSILTSDYVCTLYDTTSMSRFTMKFFTTTLNASSFTKQGDCLSPLSSIVAKGAGTGPWNYEWRSGDSLIKTCLNKSTADSLEHLGGGNYSVKISSVGQCDNFSKNFIINSIVAPFSAFVPDVFEATLSNSGKINFTNNSSNAQFSIWDFGDNSGTWYLPSPSHTYLTAGVYTVTLISESIQHCKDKSQQVIRVIDDVTGIDELHSQESVRLAMTSQGQYELGFAFTAATTLGIRLYDLNGTLLQTKDLEQVSQAKESIDLTAYAKGIYLVKINAAGGTTRTFKLLN